MKSFIIRLKNNELSERLSNECVLQASKFNVDVVKFDAVNGMEAREIFDADQIPKFSKSVKKDTDGVRGCAASHYLLWKKCAADKEPFLILEHDAYMIRPLPNNIENNFLEVCKLDSNNPYSETYNDDVSVDNGSRVTDYDLTWGYKKKSAPYGGYFRGAWAYLIKPSAAVKIIDCMRINGWVPADKQFGENILKLQSTDTTIFRIHNMYNHTNICDLSLTRK